MVMLWFVGDFLKKYIAAGISTDHECSNFNEAKKRFSWDEILIREEARQKI